MQNNNIINGAQSQAHILQKTQIKKRYNERVISWLEERGLYDKAKAIRECATFLGITTAAGYPQIVKANFCRERLCYVCAWRRQSKFIAQMLPVMEILSREHEFLFITLTLQNACKDELKTSVDLLLRSFDKLLKRKRIKEIFRGVCRSLELTYNAEEETFHPHLHLLVAVDKEYFSSCAYLSQKELSEIWRSVVGLDYTPIVWVEKVTQNANAVCETLKYSLKPSAYSESFEVFLNTLKGRRLISFTGVFSALRKKLKFSSFDEILTDDVKPSGKIIYNLYKFDATGGVYTFLESCSY